MNSPLLWNQVLEVIKFPGAVVAGGCIRDLCLGVPPKDIDVFVPCEDLQQWTDWKYAFLSDHAGVYDMSDTQEGKEYDRTDFSREANPLYGVLEGELIGQQVNIIARTTHTSPQELIELFDFAILQAYWDGESMKYNKEQAIDCQFMRATLTHDKHVAQSINRFMRFNTRHPGLLALSVPFETPYDLPQ